MSVLVNNWTQQVPMSAVGETGVQSIRHIPASRVFFKTPDSTTAAPVNIMAAYANKTNGTVPSGWTDGGIMDGVGKVVYTKKIAQIMLGIDKVVAATYVQERSAQITFDLAQLDDQVLQMLGFISSVITPGSSINFQLGQEDVVAKAVLFVYASKLDSKEIQWYHPSGQISADVKNVSDYLVASCTCDLIAFTPAGGYTRQSLVSATIFA